jgi:transcriptional regulator with XRE-family HTH domain
MRKDRYLAEELRQQGYSYNLISEKLGISKSTLSNWLKDIPFLPNEEVLERVKSGPLKAGQIRHEQRLLGISNGLKSGLEQLGDISRRDLWMLGIGLYVGEGAKTIDSIRISNSDPLVIKVFIRWLKEICGLTNDNLTMRVHIYPDNDEKIVLKYWKEVTGLPYSNFRKTIVDKRQNKSTNFRSKLNYGTAHLSVVSKGDKEKGVVLYRKIQGWVTGAMNLV